MRKWIFPAASRYTARFTGPRGVSVPFRSEGARM